MLCSRSCLVAINTSLNHFSFAGTPRGCAKASCIFASVHVTYLISLLFTTYVTTLTVVRTVWRRVSFQHLKKFISARDSTKCLLVTLNSLLEEQNLILDNKVVISSFFLFLFNFLYFTLKLIGSLPNITFEMCC